MLDKKCGTLPYVPPEVLTKPYLAQPADLWSCGIILVTMLAGGKVNLLSLNAFFLFYFPNNNFRRCTKTALNLFCIF
jgi:serine/threonine protein kinase